MIRTQVTHICEPHSYMSAPVIGFITATVDLEIGPKLISLNVSFGKNEFISHFLSPR